MLEKVLQLINETNIETHPLYYNGQFVADINETHLFNLRLMLLQQATPESVAKGERTGYYLLDEDEEGTSEYHLLSDNEWEDFNSDWYCSKAVLAINMRALVSNKKEQYRQEQLNKRSMSSKHEAYLKAEKELEKLKSELNLWSIHNTSSTPQSKLIGKTKSLPEGITHLDPEQTLYSPDSGTDYLLVVVYDQEVFDKWVKEGCYSVSKLNK